MQPRGRELGPALPSPGASVAPSGAAQRSAAGPLPAAAVRPMAQTCLLGRGRRSREDALGSAGGWNPAPGACAPTARVLLTPEPEAALACQSWGGGGEGARAPSPLELQLTPLQLFPNAPGTGTCSPTLPPTQAARVAVRNLGRGVAGGKAGSGSQDPGDKNSPANRQSFSALDFWITMSISF